MAQTPWKSRIVGHADVPPSTLLKNPLNWRIHPKAQREALESALDRIGWIRDILVNKVTGNMVDGHARVQLALGHNEPTVPVSYVELTPEEERMALASLDPLAAMAVTDPEQLFSLIDGLTAGSSLDQFLDQQRAQASTSSLKTRDPTKPRTNNKTAAYVKVVVLVDDSNIIERAILSSGIVNRGAAFAAICKEYLDRHEKPEVTPTGQHNIGAEGLTAGVTPEALSATAAAGSPRKSRRNRRAV